MIMNFSYFDKPLSSLPEGKLLISTINAHSYNESFRDNKFKKALLKSDILIPDGVSIVWATKLVNGLNLKKIAGADLFKYELERLSKTGGKCFFLGSSEATLEKIETRLQKEYPNIQVGSYSPPYKAEFSKEDTDTMIEKVNAFETDVLFVGMTAPKQEKWAHDNKDRLNVRSHIDCIGAVFDFYAGNIQRAPQWLINLGLEWSYRLVKEPQRMWRRYLIGNAQFTLHTFNDYLTSLLHRA